MTKTLALGTLLAALILGGCVSPVEEKAWIEEAAGASGGSAGGSAGASMAGAGGSAGASMAGAGGSAGASMAGAGGSAGIVGTAGAGGSAGIVGTAGAGGSAPPDLESRDRSSGSKCDSSGECSSGICCFVLTQIICVPVDAATVGCQFNGGGGSDVLCAKDSDCLIAYPAENAVCHAAPSIYADAGYSGVTGVCIPPTSP